jgi:RNA polymerase sigma-70 factor (ECF subfamily)
MQRNKTLDAFLVAAAQAGERDKLDALVRRWQPRLLAHAWRLLRDTEQAKDAVQEGWVQIIRGLRGLHSADAFPAWALQIITRRCAQTIRTLCRHRSLQAQIDAEPTPPPAPDPADDHESQFSQTRIKAALGQLNPDQHAATALFYFEGLSVAEIALALDTPSGTIKTRLMHARKRLHDILAETGDTP